MRGARWRILATPLLFFVSGSFHFISFPLYPSQNLKSPPENAPSPLLFFYISSQLPSLLADLRFFCFPSSLNFLGCSRDFRPDPGNFRSDPLFFLFFQFFSSDLCIFEFDSLDLDGI